MNKEKSERTRHISIILTEWISSVLDVIKKVPFECQKWEFFSSFPMLMHKWREYDSMCFPLTCPHVPEIYSYAWKNSIITWFQRKNPCQINACRIIFVPTMCWFMRKYTKHRFLRNFSNTIKLIFDWQFNDVKLFELHFVLWIEWNKLWHLCFFNTLRCHRW